MYTMKIDNNTVYLKNGAPMAKWSTAVFDEKSSNVLVGQHKAAEKFGVHPTTVGDIVMGRKKATGDLPLRKATAKEVRAQFGDKIKEEIKAAPKKTKKKAHGKRGPGARKYVGFRVVDGGIELVTAGGRWEPSDMTEIEAKKNGLRQAFKAKGHGNGRGPKAKDKVVATSSTDASFLAVAWPDGQVTVRAAVGAWSQHFADPSAVPDHMLAAAKVYDLAGA